jgi:hypothetical protein
MKDACANVGLVVALWGFVAGEFAVDGCTHIALQVNLALSLFSWISYGIL